jgi:hypothetical protein
MSGDAHVRFCESLGLQCPWPLDFVKNKKNKCVRKAKPKKAKKSNRRAK